MTYRIVWETDMISWPGGFAEAACCGAYAGGMRVLARDVDVVRDADVIECWACGAVVTRADRDGWWRA